MATKTLSITEEAYNRLKVLKNNKESFSDIIMRVTNKNRKSVSELYGLFPKKEADELERNIKEIRKLNLLKHKKRIREIGALN